MTSSTAAGLHRLGGALTPRFRQHLLAALAQRRKGNDQANHQGFTLVELMVVIVIVAILSAIAIPNFFNQTEKAKATEAKTMISATLKQAQAKYQEDGAAPPVVQDTQTGMGALYGTPADGTTKFNYTGNWTTPVYTIIATGSSADGQIAGKRMIGCVNMETGAVNMKNQLSVPGFSNTLVTCTPQT